MGGSPSAFGTGGAGLGQMTNEQFGLGQMSGPPGGFNWGNFFGGPEPAKNPPNVYGGYPMPAKNVGGVGSLDWMKWHPDYKPTVGTAAWGATHPDPAQNVKYGSAQWQQTHPDYQQNQVPPGLSQLGQPPNDLSEVIKHLFGGGQ